MGRRNTGPFFLNSGGRYNPVTDSWIPTSTNNVPEAREFHTAVSTGSEMIVWAGLNNGFVSMNTGGRYNPDMDSWTPTSTTNVPDARNLHTAVWTGNEMIAWGGFSNTAYFNTGGRYNPNTDTWTVTATMNAPDPRYFQTAVWTGSQMIVWGGTDDITNFDTGGKYCANPVQHRRRHQHRAYNLHQLSHLLRVLLVRQRLLRHQLLHPGSDRHPDRVRGCTLAQHRRERLAPLR